MSTGIFPKILKAAIVSPEYKKDDLQKLDNYRPISTLPVFSKNFENLIQNQPNIKQRLRPSLMYIQKSGFFLVCYCLRKILVLISE